MITTASPAGAVSEAAQVLEPPPDMTVTQWAERYRVLSAVDSAAAGRFSCDERPYQRGIMDACSKPRIQYVTVAGPSQWGKTQILNNIVWSRIHLKPGPIMVVAPTIHSVEKWSKTRFMPMVRDCPELNALIGEGRSTTNTITEKEFPGGVLVCVGANVPAGLAQQPIRDLLMDEVDRIPIDESAGKEGDFEELAEARTSDFEGRRLIYRCSSPTIKGRSRIENSLKESDGGLWWWRCPHCGHLQVCDFRQVVFDGRPKNPVYACRGGGCEITEQQLRKAINGAEAEGGGWIAQRPEIEDHAGFQVHGLMVRSMASMVSKFLRAKRKGPKALQVWVNTQCGEWWDPREGDEIQAEGLLARARNEEYAIGEVPPGVGLLVAGVDNQTSPQRIEVGVWGVGSGMELWLIEHRVIPGNLATKEPWDRLEDMLLQDWGGHRIQAVGLDVGGHYNKPVYTFCKRATMRGLAHPVKGASQPQRSLVRRATKKSSLRLVDTVSAKDLIYGQLAIEKAGPGYVHLPNDVDQVTVEQLLSERPCTKSGKRAYDKKDGPDTRNEVLDCVVYSYAAIEIFAPRDLEALVRRRAAPAPTPAQATAEPQEELPVEAEPPAPAPAREIRRIRAPRRGGGGGMTGFGGAW